MINHIKILCLLVVSSFILAQPSTIDTTKIENTEIPLSIKPVVEDIVTNSNEVKSTSVQISKEMNKQIAIIKQIKMKLGKMKKASVVNNVHSVSIKNTDKIITDTVGLKAKDIPIEVEGQVIQWETKDRTWVGKLLHKNNFIYYPFIIDKSGNKVYLK